MKTSEDRSAKLAVTVFPIAILVGITIAYFFPAPFLPLADYITYFLMLILFAMGLTLTMPDFQEIARRPWPIFLGVIGQFVIMPLFAVGVAKLFWSGFRTRRWPADAGVGFWWNCLECDRLPGTRRCRTVGGDDFSIHAGLTDCDPTAYAGISRGRRCG